MADTDFLLDQNIDETEHFFLRHVNKKLRNANKKLREIQQLESSSQALKPAQQNKISNKNKILDEKTYLESIKSLYSIAEKEAQNPHILKKPSTPDFQSPAKSFEDPKPIEKSASSSNVKPVFDLIYLSQLWLQSTYSNKLPLMKANNELMKELGVLAEFYHKLFYIPQGMDFLSNDEKVLRCQEIDKFMLNLNDEKAIYNFTYGDIGQIVKKYENLQDFLIQKEEITKEISVDIPKEIPITEEIKSLSSKEETPHVEKAEDNQIEDKKEKVVVSIKEEKKTYTNEKRQYQADSSRKYQLGEYNKNGNKNKNVGYQKNYYEKTNKKGQKEEYILEYVKKE